MRKFYQLGALLAAMSMIVACGETSSSESSAESSSAESSSSEEVSSEYTDQDLVDMAVSTAAIMTYNSTGAVVNSAKTNTLDKGDLTIATLLTVRGTQVSLAWVADPEASFTFGTLDATGHQLITVNYPAYGAEDVLASMTVTASLNQATASQAYNFTLKAPEAEEVITPLSTLRAMTSGTEVTVQGYVTGWFADYDGMYVQQGDYAVMAYKMSTYSSLGLVIGDFIQLTGTYSPYNGLAELGYISVCKKVTAPATAELPNTLALTETLYTTANLTGHDCALVHLEGLTFVSGTVSTAASTHSTVNFKIGSTAVAVYVNYHIDTAGTGARATLATLFSGLVAGDTLTYTGHLSWYSGPQLGPLSADEFTVVHGEAPTYTDQEIADAGLAAAVLTIVHSGAAASSAATVTLYQTEGVLSALSEVSALSSTVTLNWVGVTNAAVGSPDEAHKIIITPAYPTEIGAADVSASVTVTATYGTATSATTTFNFTLKAPIAVTSIADLRASAPAKNTYVRTEGFVTSFFSSKNTIYIQVGENAITLYRADLSFPGVAVTVGDYVRATGKYSPYNGLVEIGSLVEFAVVTAPVEALAPVALTLTEANWSAAALAGKDGSLAHAEGLVLVSAAPFGSTVSLTLGSTTVVLSIASAIGTTVATAVKDLLATVIAGDTLTYNGPIGWYNAPQLGITDVSQLTIVHAA